VHAVHTSSCGICIWQPSWARGARNKLASWQATGHPLAVCRPDLRGGAVPARTSALLYTAPRRPGQAKRQAPGGWAGGWRCLFKTKQKNLVSVFYGAARGGKRLSRAVQRTRRRRPVGGHTPVGRLAAGSNGGGGLDDARGRVDRQ
jgi:hypothetical protein